VFFPKDARRDVFTLYAYVRVADDFVDSIPQRKKEFLLFKKDTLNAINGKKSGDVIVDDFVELFIRKKFRLAWLLAFLDAMESDLGKVRCKNLEDTESYIYGSAEVIGLFMAKIMNLDKKSYKYAMLLGKSMQYINFIRDINEDIGFDRVYLPLNDAKRFGLKTLSLDEINKNPEGFKKFVHEQLKRFYDFDKKARLGFRYIPKKLLVPILTAQDMYFWTAKKIEANPFIVLKKKVKPRKCFIIMTMLKNYFKVKSGKK
jgi:phytoene synthase